MNAYSCHKQVIVLSIQMAYSFVCALAIYILLFGGYWIVQKHLPTKEKESQLVIDEKDYLKKTVIDIVIEFAVINQKIRENINDINEDESKGALISKLQDTYLKMKKIIGQYLTLEGLDPEYQEYVELSDYTGRMVRLVITSTRVYKKNDDDEDDISDDEETEDDEDDSEDDEDDSEEDLEYDSDEVNDFEDDEDEEAKWEWEYKEWKDEVEVSWYVAENNSHRTHPTYDL